VGAAERLERLAADLRPGAIAFVGKAAYQGAFGGRAALGPQARRLGDTALFVLPSTSPANAAVPWEERLRWFVALRRLVELSPELRPAARAIVLDPQDRILLVRFEFPHLTVWATPGGGIEPDEDAGTALRRELAEEAGLDVADLGPVVWRRVHLFPEPLRWLGQSEEYFLVRTPAFEPVPRLSWEQLNAELVTGIRWWTLDEIGSSGACFAPRRLDTLVRELLRDGPPSEPIDVGE
jgi:ADP-ribose pyrophosphatase YjhB (NUDIX family)